MRVFIFQTLEKRLQVNCLVRRGRMITEGSAENTYVAVKGRLKREYASPKSEAKKTIKFYEFN